MSNRDGVGTFSSFVDVIVFPYVILSEPDGLKWSGLIFLWLGSISSAPQQKAAITTLQDMNIKHLETETIYVKL